MTTTHLPVMKRSFVEALLLENPDPTYFRALIYRREIAHTQTNLAIALVLSST
jgi:hypothetical protein